MIFTSMAGSSSKARPEETVGTRTQGLLVLLFGGASIVFAVSCAVQFSEQRAGSVVLASWHVCQSSLSRDRKSRPVRPFEFGTGALPRTSPSQERAAAQLTFSS